VLPNIFSKGQSGIKKRIRGGDEYILKLRYFEPHGKATSNYDEKKLKERKGLGGGVKVGGMPNSVHLLG